MSGLISTRRLSGRREIDRKEVRGEGGTGV